MRIKLLVLFFALLAFSCNKDNTFAPENNANQVNQDARMENQERTILTTRADLRYVEFAVDVPNSLEFIVFSEDFFDLEIFAMDGFITDDVVEIYVDGCLLAIVDSRDYPDYEHPGETHVFKGLAPGEHVVTYVNTISSIGVSGWYVSETILPISEMYLFECATGVPDYLMGDCMLMSDLIMECAIGAKNHGKFVSCVAHLTEGWVYNGIITYEQKDAIMECVAESDIGK